MPRKTSDQPRPPCERQNLGRCKASPVLFLALDLEVGESLPGERFHKPPGELHVGEQRDREIHRRPADDVVVGHRLQRLDSGADSK
jgi:hypothetical protein